MPRGGARGRWQAYGCLVLCVCLSVCFVLFWFVPFYFILVLDTCLFSNEREKDLSGEEVGMFQEDLKEGKYIYFQI